MGPSTGTGDPLHDGPAESGEPLHDGPTATGDPLHDGQAATGDPAVGLATAIRSGDPDGVRDALRAGADPHRRDSDRWSALDLAAGRGATAVVRVLLEHGADPTATGDDLRTPYQIALAAGHLETARVLRDAEEVADPESAQRHVWRPYCRAYLLARLRRFPGWQEPAPGAPGSDHDGGAPTGVAAAAPLADTSVVFLHDDLRVTRSMWRDTGLIFDGTAEGWAAFSVDHLEFRVPDDFDLVPTGPPAG